MRAALALQAVAGGREVAVNRRSGVGLCSQQAGRRTVKCCLAPDWKDEFTGKDLKHELEWPAPPEGCK